MEYEEILMENQRNVDKNYFSERIDTSARLDSCEGSKDSCVPNATCWRYSAKYKQLHLLTEKPRSVIVYIIRLRYGCFSSHLRQRNLANKKITA